MKNRVADITREGGLMRCVLLNSNAGFKTSRTITGTSKAVYRDQANAIHHRKKKKSSCLPSITIEQSMAAKIQIVLVSQSFCISMRQQSCKYAKKQSSAILHRNSQIRFSFPCLKQWARSPRRVASSLFAFDSLYNDTSSR